jgi:anti-anti-sigma regulatory factor
MPPSRHLLEFEEVGPVTVARLTVRSIRTEEDITTLFEQLRGLTEDQGRLRLLLDFGPVQAIASYAIAKLIDLDAHLRKQGGRLAMCNLTPLFAEVLEVMQLDRHFNLYPSELEALQSFPAGPAPR